MMIMDMHLHSNFSDGKNSIEEMIIQSIDCGYTHITFADHVWKTSEWLDEYIEQINKFKKKYNSFIKIYSGVEAKVIDTDGNIDFSEKYYHQIDFVIAAFHRIPLGNGEYIRASKIDKDFEKALSNWKTSMLKVLENPRVDIIAHPTSVFGKFIQEVDAEILREIVMKAKKNNKIFEINIRRRVPNKTLLNLIKEHKLLISIGSDSHSVNDIKKYCNSIKRFNRQMGKKENMIYGITNI